ncbi:MAG: hypothetical protein WCC06_01400 [Candidatus Aminicenantales bacterium]
MDMKFHTLGAIFLVLLLTCLTAAPSRAQDQEEKMAVKSGFGFEIFSRTLSWDEDKYTSRVLSYFGILDLKFELHRGLFLSALVGYSSSNFNGLTFRQLPFSVTFEDQGGVVNGYLVGAEINQKVYEKLDSYEIGLLAQFVLYSGIKKSWEITDLNEPGILEGKPHWMRAMVGPVFCYKGYEYWSPYIFIHYNKLWGKFELTETIVDLVGTEEKKISGKSVLGLSIGTMYEPSSRFLIKGEVTLLPFDKGNNDGLGIDLGGMVKAIFTF